MTTNNPIVIVVDSDALIAQGNLTDAHHEQAIAISNKLVEMGAKVIYPSAVIIEATTLMHNWRPKEGEKDVAERMKQLALGTLLVMSDPSMIVEPIDQQVIAGAAKHYNPKATRKDTTFDCAVAAVADKHHADYIFSWDEFYTKKGFKLAADLVR